MTNLSDVLKKMSIDEKAALCAGLNFWKTKGYDKVGLPELFMSDGPHGLRTQNAQEGDHLGLKDSQQAVCYPTAAGAACSWDRDLIEHMGDMLGKDAAQRGVDILLGPGVEIKRSPLCGRNFEYYSEDPFLAGQLGAAFVRGVQKNKVSACPKHFAVNNQETRRKSVDVDIDERTLREIYLVAFEACVKEGDAWSIMTSYNKVNGYYVSENYHLSTEILRDEWGFKGIAVSDWGAIDHLVESVRAGLSVQMPGVDDSFGKKVASAVHNGQLDEAILDRVVSEFVYVANRVIGRKPDSTTHQQYHEAALNVACESMVLLKNTDNLLPLNKKMKIGVIGQMAKQPRFQGAGSSHVNVYNLTNAWDEIKKVCPDARYSDGYEGYNTNESLLEHAADLAAESDVVVCFVGLPPSYESETYDRTSIDMPEDYDLLVNKLSKINQNLVVVLSNGSCIAMPWADKVSAIFECYLGGETSGKAISKLLFGEVNPSGKLAETFPQRLEHNPSYLNFPGEKDKVRYQEGIFVGYRYYQKKKIDVLFPFGHGLSYTQFEYTDLVLDKTSMEDSEGLTVSCTVTNKGAVSGKEIVQLYVQNPKCTIIRPELELREFAKIALAPGESKRINFKLGKRAFSYYNEMINDWCVESGDYAICIGASCDDIRLKEMVDIRSTTYLKSMVTRNTLFVDILNDEVLYAKFKPVYDEIKPYLPFGLATADLEKDPMARGLLNNMTLNSLASYVGRRLDDDRLQEIINKLNA